MSVSKTGSAIVLAAAIAILPHTASAQQATTADVPAASSPAPQLDTTIRFDDAVGQGETPAPGELVKTIREFGPWTSVCSRTSKRAVCLFIQTVVNEARAPLLRWGIRQDIKGRSYIVMEMSKTVDTAAGLRLQLDGIKLAPQAVACKVTCASILPFDNVVGGWIKTGKVARFEWTSRGQPVVATGTLEGLSLALNETDKYLASVQQPVNAAANASSSGAAPALAKAKPKAKPRKPTRPAPAEVDGQ